MIGRNRWAAGLGLVSILLLMCPWMGAAGAATVPAATGSVAEPATPGQNPPWDAKAFDYDRPKDLVVEESTPTAEQVSFLGRPAQAPADAPAPKAGPAAEPKAVGAINVVHLRFRDAAGDDVPVVLCTPKDKKGPFPLVVAVHGLTSNKAQVVAQVGPALIARGFAVMALDLPCHGERPGEPLAIFDGAKLRKAVIDVRQCMDIADARADIDHKAGLTLAGYSLGSWISGVTGGADPRVKALVLMVGGTFDMGARRGEAPAMDVAQAIKHYVGRPLLMLNGKTDLLVSPDSSKRLFEAAGEPKKQVWYDSGHMLPGEAYIDAADWIDKTIRPAADKPPAK